MIDQHGSSLNKIQTRVSSLEKKWVECQEKDKEEEKANKKLKVSAYEGHLNDLQTRVESLEDKISSKVNEMMEIYRKPVCLNAEMEVEDEKASAYQYMNTFGYCIRDGLFLEHKLNKGAGDMEMSVIAYSIRLVPGINIIPVFFRIQNDEKITFTLHNNYKHKIIIGKSNWLFNSSEYTVLDGKIADCAVKFDSS